MTGALVPYTNTYTDTDGTIADSDDIVAEFDRVAEFIGAWSDSFETIGVVDVHEYTVPFDGDTDISPTTGLVQVVKVDASVVTVNLNIKARVAGDPYRIYLNLRFASKNTVFTVSAPGGQSHIFGLNQSIYSPSQVQIDGWYAGCVIVTYGTDAAHIQVFADNPEGTIVALDDTLQLVAS